MLGMVRYILYNVLSVLLHYIQMGQCNEKLLTRRKLVNGESFKVCVRLGHLEKGASRLGTATGGNTQHATNRGQIPFEVFSGHSRVGRGVCWGCDWGKGVPWESYLRKKCP